MPSKQRPDHEIHARYKSRMKWGVVVVLWAAFAIFSVALLPGELTAQLNKVVGPHVAEALKTAGGSALGPVLAIVLFSADSAFRGGGETAKWTRSILPSTVCAKERGYTIGEATTLWFRYFDTWALPGSPNRAILQNTYSATYTARMVYYLTRACMILFVASALIICVNRWVLERYESPKDAWPHALVAFLFAGFWVWLAISNEPGSADMKSEPTGAWKRVAEVFERSVVLFNQEVLKDTPTFGDAMARVEELRKKLSDSSE